MGLLGTVTCTFFRVFRLGLFPADFLRAGDGHGQIVIGVGDQEILKLAVGADRLVADSHDAIAGHERALGVGRRRFRYKGKDVLLFDELQFPRSEDADRRLAAQLFGFHDDFQRILDARPPDRAEGFHW